MYIKYKILVENDTYRKIPSLSHQDRDFFKLTNFGCNRVEINLH